MTATTGVMTLFRATQILDTKKPTAWKNRYLNIFAKMVDAYENRPRMRPIGMGPDMRNKVVRNLLVLLMPDGSEKHFVYDDGEARALHDAMNYAAEKGFVTDPKSRSMFAARKIDELFFEMHSKSL